MGIGLSKIKRVTLRLTDVRRSVGWYQSLLDLELYMELTRQGVVRLDVLPCDPAQGRSRGAAALAGLSFSLQVATVSLRRGLRGAPGPWPAVAGWCC